MATYAIGDVQGCFAELQMLLTKINFQPAQDELWFTGDLINRGPESLAVLRFVKQLPRVKIVLGNHDLHLIALASGADYANHTLTEVLNSPDCDELIQWLRFQPLLHYDKQLNYVITHAGIYPFWNLVKAQQCAREVEQLLQSDDYHLLIHLYGNEPNQWREELIGWDRLRFIINAFTRMRFCTADGILDLITKESMDKQPEGYMAWFNVPTRVNRDVRIIFGHWAALQGKTNEANLFALDTGCVWGNRLTAMRLEDQQLFSVPALRSNTTKL